VGHQEGAREPRRCTPKVEIQSNLGLQSMTSCQSQCPGPPCLQIDVWTPYDLQFGHSLDAWKDKKICFQLNPFHGQLKSESSAIINTRLISKTFLTMFDRSY
jgi:hypothetical protein